MLNLVSDNPNFFKIDVLGFMIIGLGCFVLGMMIAVFVSRKSIFSLISSNMKTVMAMLVLSLLLPLTLGQTLQSTNLSSKADAQVQISAINLSKVSSSSVDLNFDTVLPSTAYLEYTDSKSNVMVPVVPDNPSQSTIHHLFKITKMSAVGGKVVFVVNGKRYLYNNQPYSVKP